MIVTIRTNWRRWIGWLEGRGLPEPSEHVPTFCDDTVLVTEPFDVTEMRDWLHANTRSVVMIYGQWAMGIDRTLDGLLVGFSDPDEAFFFKLRWG